MRIKIGGEARVKKSKKMNKEGRGGGGLRERE